jgi:hypothetical protein
MEVWMLFSLIFMTMMGPVHTDKRASKIHRMITQARVVHDFLIVEALWTGISQMYLWLNFFKLNSLKIMTNGWFLQLPIKINLKILEISYLIFWCQIQLPQFCSHPTSQLWMEKLPCLTVRANCSISVQKTFPKIIILMMKIYPPAIA